MSDPRNAYISELLDYLTKGFKSTFSKTKKYIESKAEESYDKKIERELAKAEQKKEQSLHAFYNHLGLSETATQEEINNAVLNKFREADIHECRFLPLSESQQNDPDFMLSLISARPQLSTYYEFTPSKTLQSNPTYMAKYIKYRYLEKNEYTVSIGLREKELGSFLKYDYYPSMEIALSPEFTETLGAELPSENVLKAVRECIINYRGVYDTYKTQDKKMEQFETLTEALTPEFLIEQAGKFGKDFISIIPQNHPYRLELLEQAINHDGFKSLGTLNVNEFISTIESDGKREQVLNTEIQPLILRAYEKDGFEGLKKFTHETLNPNRNDSYMCHGEIHDWKHYSPTHAKVQNLILYDEDIYPIFAEEYVRTHQNPEA